MAITTLGDHLRVCRERLRPQDVGLPGGTRRRVPGLRREEVALLAGISVEYYLRLEQGRDRHPSDQVLGALARALQLDQDAERYLHDLARPAPAARRRRTPRPERVGAGVRSLIDSWPATPALVQDLSMTTVAANAVAVALSPYFSPGVNTLRAAFLEPEMRELYEDWDAMTAKAVAYLRSMTGPEADDPRLVEVVGELSLRSERFRTLWAKQIVRLQTSGTSRFRHPQVGPLELHYEKLALPNTQGQILVTYHARAGSESYERLELLAHLARGNRPGPDSGRDEDRHGRRNGEADRGPDAEGARGRRP
ncbi:helix-turn-helix domain-containing protein [Streptomyces fuscigenes]|uniref:helix-turn-helix domain-containing protein n=1 Tax=Streptomyces fuscigenes TaxID=1528880 RepID=UPI001F16925E|nr:helix-turn-helix transcriptional regulator [Streptomyces fuscigenes]MCF3963765.1 helix-turn-helix transcriptional regulator [Streptomyces fuscigenes]